MKSQAVFSDEMERVMHFFYYSGCSFVTHLCMETIILLLLTQEKVTNMKMVKLHLYFKKLLKE